MLPSLLFLLLLGVCSAIPLEQQPLLAEDVKSDIASHHKSGERPLHGRFLHITDFHPDPFYKPFADSEDENCHRGKGTAGIYGAETTDCDSPFTLVNATFQWLADHVKDDIDFIIWTGDSAKHDNDEKLPRTETQVIDLNKYLVSKFTEVFGKDDNINDTDPTNDFIIPIVPNFGNNDIVPHNIMTPGPNRWTKDYAKVWRSFIPEVQRHSFDRGGWFFVEVIPNKLAVFSLNTLYFFASNTAVDGCAKKSEPGYEQMEWLRIQLQFLRERGMKAIMMGHVPPARTDSKESWDETCWQKYTLWMEAYRDVVVGGVYGHMNIEHFMLQDSKHISKKTREGLLKSLGKKSVEEEDEEFGIQSKTEYLTDLREEWKRIPNEPKALDESEDGDGWLDRCMKMLKSRKHKSKKDKYLKKIGGEWAERYSVSLVTASVVPNYFPTFRIVEYNTTGLESLGTPLPISAFLDETADAETDEHADNSGEEGGDLAESYSKRSEKHHTTKKHKKKKHPKNGKTPTFTVPSPPPSSAKPGPAYSPQPLTWLSYKQYYANLTRINPPKPLRHGGEGNGGEEFKFKLEYDTATDPVYNMPDLTVRSWVSLARRIGKYKPTSSWPLATTKKGQVEVEDVDKATKKKNKKKRRKEIENLWFTFISRAYVGTKEREEIEDEFA